MRALRLALIYANWAGSLVFGFLHAPVWLLVPVAAWTSFAFGATSAIAKHQEASGVENSQYAKMMFLPNILLVGRNAGINFMLFGMAWGLSLLFGTQR